jgi:hypothetical protein
MINDSDSSRYIVVHYSVDKVPRSKTSLCFKPFIAPLG